MLISGVDWSMTTDSVHHEFDEQLNILNIAINQNYKYRSDGQANI